MTYQHILYDVLDRVATITFNRPKERNFLDEPLLEEWVDALRAAERDAEVRVVVIKGAGSAFCAGYNMDQSREYESMTTYDGWVGRKDWNEKISTTWELRKPVIAQVHGWCVSGGVEMIGQCDITIAASNARFYNPHARGWALSYLHMGVYHMGPQWTKIMMYTGDIISGTVAERIGLVAKAVPEARLEETVRRLANRIALVPSELLALHKATVNRVVERMGRRDVLDTGLELDVIARTNNRFIEDFRQTAAEKGWKAAFDAVDRPFRELPLPFDEPSEGEG
jgi:enoyl-CoA hydratase